MYYCEWMTHHCVTAAQPHSRSPVRSIAFFPPPPLISLSLFSSCPEPSCPTFPFSFPRIYLICGKLSILLLFTEKKRGNSVEVQVCTCHFHENIYSFSLLFPFPFLLPSPSPLLFCHRVEATRNSSLLFFFPWVQLFSVIEERGYF